MRDIGDDADAVHFGQSLDAERGQSAPFAFERAAGEQIIVMMCELQNAQPAAMEIGDAREVGADRLARLELQEGGAARTRADVRPFAGNKGFRPVRKPRDGRVECGTAFFEGSEVARHIILVANLFDFGDVADHPAET